MAVHAVVFLLCLLRILHEAPAALVQTQRTVMAAAGDGVRLSCRLTQQKDVRQVTWKKVFLHREEDVATYSSVSGQRVSSTFREKVKFEEAGLQNSSIMIREVTEQDEGCYHCLFNTFPQGALTGTTCLTLYELYGPVLQVQDSDSPAERVVSCWATGRPPPTLTLRVLTPDVHFSNYSLVRVTDTNGSVTINSSAVIPCFYDNGTTVGCVVQVPCGPERQAVVMVPAIRREDVGLGEESESRNRSHISGIVAALVPALLCASVAGGFISFRRNQKSQSRSHSVITDVNETLQTLNKDSDRAEVTQENEQVRKRTPEKEGTRGETRADSRALAAATRRVEFD